VLILENEFENDFPPTLIHYYLAFRSYDQFLQKYDRPPGSNESFESDLTEMLSFVTHILSEPPSNPTMVSNACLEMFFLSNEVDNSIRAGGGELHNIASVMGGLVSQECIKLITRQYIPSDNTCVFDGISSSTNVLPL
jgi:NEDD8-activating enzyme E1 regulatory subunit